MSYQDVYIAERTLALQAELAARRAESRRQVHEAHVKETGWLARRSCWMLCQLGRRLIAWGSRLEQYGLGWHLAVER